jgi:hypothetical protein
MLLSNYRKLQKTNNKEKKKETYKQTSTHTYNHSFQITVVRFVSAPNNRELSLMTRLAIFELYSQDLKI